ncbi:hypothetical protein N7462_006684 [Penicillium macrosclerotiorum]|uniref:uncharacterized protein n=1 Tax=Penicillium macrosclerotiorum TaxID=303699 RepID=UPI002547E52C|nr:uncharacterized protein N7462_006684 [Penicillium macrosclerotiorum]KAJ5683519.1 hypothetical protein N7462_006684 [Penicillium macrosclerotiorum]
MTPRVEAGENGDREGLLGATRMKQTIQQAQTWGNSRPGLRKGPVSAEAGSRMPGRIPVAVKQKEAWSRCRIAIMAGILPWLRSRRPRRERRATRRLRHRSMRAASSLPWRIHPASSFVECPGARESFSSARLAPVLFPATRRRTIAILFIDRPHGGILDPPPQQRGSIPIDPSTGGSSRLSISPISILSTQYIRFVERRGAKPVITHHIHGVKRWGC